MKAERQQKEATSRVIQPSKGGGGHIVDNRPLSLNQANMIQMSLDEYHYGTYERKSLLVTKDISGDITSIKFDHAYIRGGSTTTDHQELIFTSGTSDECLRISRNNSYDTIQYPASDERSKSTYKTTYASCKTDVTGERIFSAFMKVHDDMSYYDQGNCGVFAGSVYAEVTGETPPVLLDLEDFM